MDHPQSFRRQGWQNVTTFALAVLALDIALIAVGAFRGDDNNAWRYFLIVVVIAAVATAVVFWGVVPRVRDLARGALILAIVGAVSLIVFWLGLPVIIAGGAILLALHARQDPDQRSRAGDVALVIGVVTIAAAALVAFIG
jgi:hypothetical protein